MKSPASVPLSVPDLRGREEEYLAECVADNWVSSAGPAIDQFAARVAALCERRHGIPTVNGTAALHLALIAAGVRPGDLVAVPDFTFAASANAICHAGGTPYFIDVDEASWTLDPVLLAEALKRAPKRVGAVMPVHALGHPADMDRIADAADGIPVIADAAGALGSTYGGRPAAGFGDCAVLSFNGNKIMTTGGGGMVLTDREDWADRLRSLSSQSRSGERYSYEEVGFNYRMTNVNAAIGLAQLERFDEMLAARRTIAGRYDAALRGRDDLLTMPRAEWAESNCWLYSVLCASAADAESLVARLAELGIEARVFWEVLSRQKPWAEAPAHLNGVAERLSGTVVSLPCSSNLTEVAQDKVIAALKEWQGTTRRRVA